MKLRNIFYSLVFLSLGFASCATPTVDYQGDLVDQLLDEICIQKTYVFDVWRPALIEVSTEIVSAVETESSAPASPFETIINYDSYRVPLDELNVIANDKTIAIKEQNQDDNIRLPFVRYL